MNRQRLQFIVFLALLIVVVMVVSGVGAAPKDDLRVSLSAAQTSYSASQDVLVTVTISNPNKNSVRILKWFTPADGVEEPLFNLQRDGEPVSYTGAIYKRPAATGNDYITLKAGESITNIVSLGDYYDLSGTGEYEISYAVASYNLFNEKGNGSKYQDSLASDPISLSVEGRAAKGKPAPPPPPPSGGNSFDACTATQQSDLVAARSAAKAYATNSQNYLSTMVNTSKRYGVWFGTFTNTRFTAVSTHFTALSSAWDNASVTFHCGCKQNYYAYVYPNQPYNIYLCKVFWLAPLQGTDSKGGTLIHEMSHFYVVASTDDYVYGQTGAMNLAISNPDNAIMNADNHEYFAENIPPLNP